MTAAKKKAQRAPDEDEPNSGKLPEGTPTGEPQPDPEPPSDPEDPPEDPQGEAPKKPEEVKPVPPTATKTKESEPPSLLARFARWWASDLDGN